MKVGRRLAMKLLNASRFALSQSEPRGPFTVPVDRAMITGRPGSSTTRPHS